MEIHRTNHTRPADNYTDRIQVYPAHTENFKVVRDAGGGATIEAKCFDYTWKVTLSADETKMVRQCLGPN